MSEERFQFLKCIKILLFNIFFLENSAKKIIKVSGEKPPIQTDGSPSTFWLTNALNVMEGNVAAGSSDTG